jgi:hypothetical protein
MTAPDPAYLQRLADECVALVARQYDRRLDWSAESLETLDELCAELLGGGPLGDERLELWWRLIGAYTGEVLVRTHSGQWTTHETSPRAPAVSALGVTAFPFALAARVLQGEPYKSLAALVRALPAVANQANAPTVDQDDQGAAQLGPST